MLAQELRPRERLSTRSVLQSTLPLLLILAFSVLYFISVYILAKEKNFWYDELCTLYICQLPTLHQSWEAVLHGADYNPPLFYVIMRTARAVLGEGHITFRLPAITGFWVFCLCLFRIVHRQAGIWPAVVAMCLPMMSGAFYYATEARPHGIVLGFCGLATLLWQLASERDGSGGRGTLWLIAFSSTLLAASLTHCYAVLLGFPFACAELAYVARFRRLRWSTWIAITAPIAVAGLCLLPLLRSYSHIVKNTGFGFAIFHADLGEIGPFYSMLLAPCALPLLCAVVMFAVDGLASSTAKPWNWAKLLGIDAERMALALGFVAFPLFGVFLGMIVGGPFISRYFLSALAGVCLLLGWRLAARPEAKVGVALICFLIFGLLFSNTRQMMIRYSRGVGEDLIEPSVGYKLDTTPGNPLATYSLLVGNSAGSLPIAIPNQLDFLYLTSYAPNLVPRLHLISPNKQALDYKLVRAVRIWCHRDFNSAETFDEFLAENKHFLFYSADYGVLNNIWVLSQLVENDRKLKSFKVGPDHVLAEVVTKQ